MILGTGIDIIEIKRIKKAVERWGDSFLNHIFHKDEIAYAQENKFPYQHYAARFAAKEAVFKSIGDNPHVTWKDIKVVNDRFGKPCCEFQDKNYKNTIQISLSHSKDYAVAFAIITPPQKRP